MRFRDRTDAGRMLAEELRALELDDPVVLALPRGGVPVGFEVARALDAPLEVFVVRKIGEPGHREHGIGAVAEGGGVVARGIVERLGLSAGAFDVLADAERRELERRVALYRGERPLPPVADRDVIVVDDGLATGVTAEAALRSLRASGPRRLVLAVPVAAPDTARRLAQIADAVVSVITPSKFYAVGQWYERFTQTTDAEVLDVLERSRTTDA